MKHLDTLFFTFFLFVLIFTLSCGKTEEEATELIDTISSQFEKSTVSSAMKYNQDSHENDEDYIWSENETIAIALSDSGIEVESENCQVDGSVLQIVSAGTYAISGSLSDGRIIVNTQDTATVRLLFQNVNINCTTGSPVYIASAEKCVVILEDGSVNSLSDADAFIYDSIEEEEPNATLFSSDDLSIYGTGILNINSNFNDAISSKDGLVLRDANININSEDDGIRGKDYIIIYNANLTIVAGGDALKSDNDENPARGYVYIEGGVINLNSVNDAIQAETDVLIKNGDLTVKSGGGSGYSVSSYVSAKGIKSKSIVIIDGGTISLDAADDAIHSNNYLSINGGDLTLSSSDDAIHTDSIAGITGGNIVVLKSYEGLESSKIYIGGGSLNIISSDDGINVGGGNDGSGFQGNPPGQTSSEPSVDYFLYMHGGNVVVNATGDGVDINGSIYMDEGTLIVHGPTANNNGALDYDASFTITGGTLIAAGSSGMAQAPDESSTQFSVIVKFSAIHQSGTLINLQTKQGEEIVTFGPEKNFQSFVFSSPALCDGLKCILYYEGSSTGSQTNGLYSDGVYSPGNKLEEFTIKKIVESL